MCTVPAHSFWAPTRAKLLAAARFMPGVCAVFVSSWSAGITRTPSCFQSVGCGCVMAGGLLGRGRRQHLLQLARLVHLHHDVRAADEFAAHVQLGDGGPVAVFLDALANA